MAMKVSILLTSYNLVDYIDESIGSVVHMEMPFDWELIIGDDGSTDGTVEKIKIWVDKYPNNIKLIEIDRNNDTIKTGSRAARNRALLLELAKGEYINFLDGDDCFLGTNKFVQQVKVLDNPNNRDCSCCAHNIEAFNIPEQRMFLMCNKSMPEQKLSIERYWKDYYFHTNTILFRKECASLLLKPLFRNYLNDNFITFLLLQFGQVIYLPDVWARYNMTGSGLWTGHSKVYGRFRNIQIVDLQLYLRNDLKRIIEIRHRNDIKTIRKEYKAGMEAEIKPLIENLDPKIFILTNLLSKNKGLTLREKISKKWLYTTNVMRCLFIKIESHLR